MPSAADRTVAIPPATPPAPTVAAAVTAAAVAAAAPADNREMRGFPVLASWSWCGGRPPGATDADLAGILSLSVDATPVLLSPAAVPERGKCAYHNPRVGASWALLLSAAGDRFACCPAAPHSFVLPAPAPTPSPPPLLPHVSSPLLRVASATPPREESTPAAALAAGRSVLARPPRPALQGHSDMSGLCS